MCPTPHQGQTSGTCWNRGLNPRSLLPRYFSLKICHLESKEADPGKPKGLLIYTKKAWGYKMDKSLELQEKEEGERKCSQRDEFWRKVFGEPGALEMKYLGMSRLGEDEYAGSGDQL